MIRLSKIRTDYSVASKILDDGDEVAFAVFEPRGILRAKLSDAIDGFQVRIIVVLERNTPRA